MKIEFEYIDKAKCNLKNKEYKHWGCCCICANRLELHKHCCHSPDGLKGKCVCGDSLKVYICKAFNAMGETRRVNLCGKHGVCECFIKTEIKG